MPKQFFATFSNGTNNGVTGLVPTVIITQVSNNSYTQTNLVNGATASAVTNCSGMYFYNASASFDVTQYTYGIAFNATSSSTLDTGVQYALYQIGDDNALLLNSSAMNFTGGNLQVTAQLNGTQSNITTGTWMNVGSASGTIAGSVLGGVNGSIGGSIGGSVFGSMNGSIGGNVIGSVQGSVNGNIGGSVVGSVNGNVGGSVIGGVNGSLGGSIGGSVFGSVNGSIGGSVLGTTNANIYAVNGSTSTAVALTLISSTGTTLTLSPSQVNIPNGISIGAGGITSTGSINVVGITASGTIGADQINANSFAATAFTATTFSIGGGLLAVAGAGSLTAGGALILTQNATNGRDGTTVTLAASQPAVTFASLTSTGIFGVGSLTIGTGTLGIAGAGSLTANGSLILTQNATNGRDGTTVTLATSQPSVTFTSLTSTGVFGVGSLTIGTGTLGIGGAGSLTANGSLLAVQPPLSGTLTQVGNSVLLNSHTLAITGSTITLDGVPFGGGGSSGSGPIYALLSGLLVPSDTTQYTAHALALGGAGGGLSGPNAMAFQFNDASNIGVPSVPATVLPNNVPILMDTGGNYTTGMQSGTYSIVGAITNNVAFPETTFTVGGTNSGLVTITGTAVQHIAPIPGANQVNYSGYSRDTGGGILASALVWYKKVDGPIGVGSGFDSTELSVTSGTDGYFVTSVQIGAGYQLKVNSNDYSETQYVTNADGQWKDFG